MNIHRTSRNTVSCTWKNNCKLLIASKIYMNDMQELSPCKNALTKS